MNNHESKGQNQSSGSAVVEVNVPSRVSQACRACAANHLRCSETKPCERCLSRDTMCVWDDLVSTSARNALTPPPTTYRSEDASISPGSQHSDAGFPIIDVFDQAQSKETSTRMNPTIRGKLLCMRLKYAASAADVLPRPNRQLCRPFKSLLASL